MKLSLGQGFWFAARLFSGFIFAYAGWAKLNEPSANFEASLLRYGIFSPQWIPLLAATLPWIEWLLGSFLILGYAPRLVAAGCSFLSLAFLVTLSSSRLFLESGSADCGCFGQSGFHLSIRQIFFVDLVSLCLTTRLALARDFPWSLHSIFVKRNDVRDDIKNRRPGKREVM